MAKNIYRVTPRVSQVMRAIEDEVLRQWREKYGEEKTSEIRVVFDHGDFKFPRTTGEEPQLEVTVVHATVASALANNRDFSLDHHHYKGIVVLTKHQSATNKRETLYSTERVTLTSTAA
jgi:hypothetical protein